MVTIDDKVAFLNRPDSYPCRLDSVEPVEMSAVEYRYRQTADICKNLRDLIAPPIGLPRETVEPVAEAMD